MKLYDAAGNVSDDKDWEKLLPGKIMRIDWLAGEVTIKFVVPKDGIMRESSWLQVGWDVTLVPEHYSIAERE